MSPSERINRYLDAYRRRLIRLSTSRGLAAIALAAAAITVVAVLVAIRTGFPGELMVSARLVLLAAVAGLAVFLVVRPARRIREDGTDDIEARTPAFDGRIATYEEMRDDGNPLRELLAEDALKIAASHPPDREVPGKDLAVALGTAIATSVALLVLGIAGSGNFGYGVRDLWLGWAFPNVAPPQSIAVTPGDDGIRAGGSVRVRAAMQGFAPGEAFVHARFGDDAWQRVSMAEREGGFEFTFFSVREPLEYYVSAASVRSPDYRIAVVDLPNVERLTNTYTFPDWTQREPETRDPGGDVRAVAGTVIDVGVVASAALTPAVLVVNEQEIDLDIDDVTGTASFTVEEEGQYYVAAVVGGERIRLTDDYFISVLDDSVPEISFTKPGRDWSASPVEEVTARISATDDYLVEGLSLHYSVNGGEWRQVELPAGEREIETEHVFFLESLLDDQDPPVELVPGDLVSYYAVASDRENDARTDIFFVDVQPFDRRYSQSQMGGGGGQQGGGNQQSEISQRQREIIVSTWNLIREQQDGTHEDDMYVPNNAALLSRLQDTLRQQAETLAERTRARMLTSSDEKIAEFVANLDKAAEAMVPAAMLLQNQALEDAIMPEQEALQYLLRAEAVFTDISLSMQANSRGGGGGQAGRDLTDMFELEMDLEKNQYETGSQATPDAPQQQLDEIGDELEELARRQEQLANRLERDRQPTPAQRWQQDLLRREAEELRDRLERMQQQASNRQQGQQQAESQQPSQGQQGQQGQPGQTSQQGGEQGQPSAGGSDQRQAREMDQLRRRLDSALRAMDDANEAMRDGSDPEASQRAASEAQRQLEGAREQAEAERERLMQARLGDLSEQAEAAYRDQAAMDERLQEAIRQMMADQSDNDRLDGGLSFSEEMEMANRKRQLQSRLQEIEQAVDQAANELEADNAAAADELSDALNELREQEVDARLAIAAAYIERGEAVYVSGSESAITQSLRDFTESLRRAESLAANGRPPGDRDGRPGLAETLADTQNLRRQLQAMNEAARRAGAVTSTGRDDRQESTGEFVPDIDTAGLLDRDIDRVSDDVVNLFRQLREGGLPDAAIDELRQLAADVRASDFSGNEALLERESQAALTRVEQLELALSRAVRSQSASVRAAPADRVPDEHREPVANYFRRLGESGDDDTRDD